MSSRTRIHGEVWWSTRRCLCDTVHRKSPSVMWRLVLIPAGLMSFVKGWSTPTQQAPCTGGKPKRKADLVNADTTNITACCNDVRPATLWTRRVRMCQYWVSFPSCPVVCEVYCERLLGESGNASYKYNEILHWHVARETIYRFDKTVQWNSEWEKKFNFFFFTRRDSVLSV